MMRQAFIRQVTIKQNNNDKIKKETNMYYCIFYIVQYTELYFMR